MLLLRTYNEYRPKDSFGAGHEGIQEECKYSSTKS